jgi:adenine phosphoribosyltransferase
MDAAKTSEDALKARIRHVPDFPKPGILFYDVTTLLKDPDGFRMAVDAMTTPHAGARADVVVGIESRGFIFGAAIADRLRAGFVPVRKLGKLPAKARKATYSLEYGEDCLEMHEDAITPGQRVLIVDDLLATGGTAAATVSLVKGLGGDILAVQFLIELAGLNGRARLSGETVSAVLKY